MRTLVLAALLLGAPVAAQAPLTFVVPVNGKVMLTVDGREVAAFVSPGMPSDPYLSRQFTKSAFGDEAGQFVDDKKALL